MPKAMTAYKTEPKQPELNWARNYRGNWKDENGRLNATYVVRARGKTEATKKLIELFSPQAGKLTVGITFDDAR